MCKPAIGKPAKLNAHEPSLALRESVECAPMRKLVILLLALLVAPAWAQHAPLFEAVAAGRLEQVVQLIGAGAAVNARNNDGETPLYAAAEAGHGAIVSFLLGKGADVNIPTKNGETVLHAAALTGDAALITLLLDRGAEPDRANRDGERPLFWAALAGMGRAAQLAQGLARRSGGGSAIAAANNSAPR